MFQSEDFDDEEEDEEEEETPVSSHKGKHGSKQKHVQDHKKHHDVQVHDKNSKKAPQISEAEGEKAECKQQ